MGDEWESVRWFREQMLKRPDLLAEVFKWRSGEELLEEDKRDEEESVGRSLEETTEYIVRSVKRFEPLLLLAASHMPPEEREEYIKTIESVKEKWFPTFNCWLYASRRRYLFRKAVQVLEEVERRGKGQP